MKEYTDKEWRERQCSKKLGHDWALQDQSKYILKVCLRCGCKQYFFPEELEKKPEIWGQTWSDDE